MRARNAGMTLAELLLVAAVMGIVSAAAAGLLSISLQGHEETTARTALHRDGVLAMERMTDVARRCTFLHIPNSHSTPRTVLAVSGFVNDDKDLYFGDPLFPRIDEDVSGDMNDDSFNGIVGLDDDGDAQVDERTTDFSATDDDEDGLANEDPLNGLDDDGDGNVDEDCDEDSNGDGAPGLAGVDDDGDGQVDEGHPSDDDEDGIVGEQGLQPIVFSIVGRTLTEHDTATNETSVLSERVEQFSVEFLDPRRIRITLQLVSDVGERLRFVENVCLRNALQTAGKRVR